MKINSRVSVCIPAYNQPEFTARAVASVFSQTFQDFEVIITDDSESDEVAEAISPWRNDARMVYCRNKRRLGSPENWNAAMQMARSDLIKFLHHDDWFATDDALERFVFMMEVNPDVDFVFSSSNACEDDGRLIFVHKPQPMQIELLRERPWELQFANFIGAPSATIFRRRDGFSFNVRLNWVVDIEGYLRLLGNRPRFDFISEALISTSANGEHQVTRFFLKDSVSRIWEHLYLYSDNVPKSLIGRVKGFLFICKILSAADRFDLGRVSNIRSQQRRLLEEKIAILVQYFRIFIKVSPILHSISILKRFYVKF